MRLARSLAVTFLEVSLDARQYISLFETQSWRIRCLGCSHKLPLDSSPNTVQPRVSRDCGTAVPCQHSHVTISARSLGFYLMLRARKIALVLTVPGARESFDSKVRQRPEENRMHVNMLPGLIDFTTCETKAGILNAALAASPSRRLPCSVRNSVPA